MANKKGETAERAALVVVVVRDSRRDDPDQLPLVGVAASEADCDPVTDDAVGDDVSNHPQYPAAPFYTAQDRPRMEALVHNLEHGYTVAWYAEDLPQAQVDQLEQIAGIARDEDATAGKFIVSAWDDAYGELPEGKRVAISHWGAETGHRQLCGSVSGEVVESFVTEYPSTDSPEPNAA